MITRCRSISTQLYLGRDSPYLYLVTGMSLIYISCNLWLNPVRSIGPRYLATSLSVAYIWSIVEFQKGPPSLIGLPHGVSSRRFHRSARVSRMPTHGIVWPSLSYIGWWRFISPAIISRPIGNLAARSSRGLAQLSSLQGKYTKYTISSWSPLYRQTAAQSSPASLVHILIAILLLTNIAALLLPYTIWYWEDYRQYSCFVCLLIYSSWIARRLYSSYPLITSWAASRFFAWF